MRSIQAGLLLVLSLLVGVAGAKAGPGALLLTIPNPAPATNDFFGNSVAGLTVAGGAVITGLTSAGAGVAARRFCSTLGSSGLPGPGGALRA